MPSTTRVGSKTVGELVIGPPSGSSHGRGHHDPAREQLAGAGPDRRGPVRVVARAGDLDPHLVGDRAALEPGGHLVGEPVAAGEGAVQPVGLGGGGSEDVADPRAGAVGVEPAVGVDRVEGDLGEAGRRADRLGPRAGEDGRQHARGGGRGTAAGSAASRSPRSSPRRPRGRRSGTAARSGRAGRWPSGPGAGTSRPCRGCPASRPTAACPRRSTSGRSPRAAARRGGRPGTARSPRGWR